MKEHNTNFYSLKNIKETLESYDGFLDGEEVYYHIGALRYAYEEIERLNNVIDELEKEINAEYVSCHDVETIAVLNDIMRKLEELKGSDKNEND